MNLQRTGHDPILPSVGRHARSDPGEAEFAATFSL
jgi:hypothetical protein